MKLRITLTALSPLSHGAFSDGSSGGNAMAFRREPILTEDGLRRVPVISGNAVRGVMRRNIMRELLDRSGVTRASMDAALEGKSMRGWDRLYAALAQGGTIEEMEKVVSPSEIRERRAALPPLSLFGAALYSSLLSGQMSIGFAWPVCRETVAAGIVVTDIPEVELQRADDLISDTGLVRHVNREEADTLESGVTPMPYTIEVLATGTELQSSINLTPQVTEIEFSCLCHAIKSLRFIGGKSATGFGEVRVSSDVDLDDKLYLEWLDHRDENAAALYDLARNLA